MDLNLDPEIAKKIQELQVLQQNLQAIVMEEQILRQNLLEIQDAIEELRTSEGKTFKLIGEIFVEKNKEDLLNELESRKEVLEIKMESLEKQKLKLKEKLEQLQKELIPEENKENKSESNN
jgi:prefoldin beta subunit